MNKMKKAAAVIVCFIVFLMGVKASDLMSNAACGSYTNLSRYGNIEIYAHDGYNNEKAMLYLNDLKSLPKGLIENCDNIFFTNENLNEKFDLGIKTKVVATSSGRDIYISTEYYDISVLVHELFHVYDYANDWISETNEFRALYEEYKDEHEVSPGNFQTRYEFFASYGERFYLEKSALNDDTLFAFFDNLNIF